MNLIRNVQKVMGSLVKSPRNFVAVCQLTSDHSLEKNLEICASMIRRAKERNCQMVFFPECFDYVGRNKEETIGMAFSENGEFMGKFRSLAKENGLWLSLGGFHNRPDGSVELPRNTHIIIDNEGNTRALYNKLHVFDLDIPGKVRLVESEFSRAGEELVHPVDSPIGRLGLNICYDLRFVELALFHRKRGAEILCYPSAFTVPTGLAHWETLLRCRAIETQCYVIAAAQTGKHNEKRSSYGHSMIVDPWGSVIAQCSETVDMCFAEINLDFLEEVRTNQPVFEHRRSDLYSVDYNVRDNTEEPLKFAEHNIPNTTIFYRSLHSFAFVNLKPVVPGHVLISPIRQTQRLTQLTNEETADLFITAKKVQKMLEEYYGSNASTVCVQDGTDAGQTVQHVHVHILPRKKADFGSNPDGIYGALDIDRKPRPMEEMEKEAAIYKPLLK